MPEPVVFFSMPGTRIRCSLGNFYSPAQRHNLHRGNIPDPIDEEWKVHALLCPCPPEVHPVLSSTGMPWCPAAQRVPPRHTHKAHAMLDCAVLVLCTVQVVRRRADSLDAGVPSTSGRAAASSSSRAPLASGSSASSGAASSSKARQVDSYNLEDSWDLTDDATGGYTPFPSNLPTSEGGLDGTAMEFWHMSSGVHLSDSKEVWGKLGQVRSASPLS